jgi:monoamine oxidase
MGVVDAVVLGAGVAGLAAARGLSAAGRTAIVLEARDRIGGRIFTKHPPDWPIPIELGAEFIHGRSEETFRLARSGGLRVVRVPDRHRAAGGGAPAEFWERIERILSPIPISRHDVSLSDFLRRSRLSRRDRQLALDFVEGFHAADPDRISARSIAVQLRETRRPGGSAQHRLRNGYDGLVEELSASLDPDRIRIRLESPATAVRWKRGLVVVDGRGRNGRRFRITARAVVVALPSGVLRAPGGALGAVAFEPEPRGLAAFLSKVTSGIVAKIVFRFREPFWAEKTAFFHFRGARIPVWWTAAPEKAATLTAWSGGPRAERLLSLGRSDLFAAALSDLCRSFRVSTRRAESLLEGRDFHDWQSDPFSRGAYAYATVGAPVGPRSPMPAVENTIFFAGDAMDPRQLGTVSGALATGGRAGRQAARQITSS